MTLAIHTGAGLSLNDKIEREASGILDGEANLSRGYARLAGLLVAFKFSEGWRETQHGSFNAYILALSDRYNRSPQQLYAYVTVAERLLPAIGEEGLDRMGIGKATELTRAAKQAKALIPQALLDSAMDSRTTIAQIKALAHQTFELKGELPKGKFIDLGGFYADEEQYRTFVDAVKVSMRILNLPPDMPQWQQRQRIHMFWAQEILGTYEAEVYGQSDAPQ